MRLAKAAGDAVTAEVTPHHLALTEEALATYDTVFKVNPPLRTAADVAALRQGLGDGTIDAVATDHAPHPPEAKQVAFGDAAPGMIGPGDALWPSSWAALAGCTGRAGPGPHVLATGRASPGLSGAHGGPLVPGAPANLCVIDPARAGQVVPAALASRSRNTPFAGLDLTGKVRHTVLAGEPVVIAEEAQR